MWSDCLLDLGTDCKNTAKKKHAANFSIVTVVANIAGDVLLLLLLLLLLLSLLLFLLLLMLLVFFFSFSFFTENDT